MLGSVFALLHTGAFIILLFIDLPISLRLILAVSLMGSLYRMISLHVLRRGQRAVGAVRLLSDDSLLLRAPKSKRWYSATIDARFVHPTLVLLRTKREGQRFPSTIMVPADAVDREAFRRLRARLLAPPQKPAA